MNTTDKNLNRRALPKFLLWVGIGALVGFCAGLASGILGGLNAEEWVSVRLPAALGAVAPWGIPVTSAILLGVCLGQYRAAKKLCDSWDGEDEQLADSIEITLSYVLLVTALATILDFFFLSAAFLSDTPLITALLFLASIVLVVLLQQRAVDLSRRMNPEKRGSVYDTKFQKKWMDSCDEAERAQIGQASYQAFRVTTGACLGLWVVFTVLNFSFDIGLLPSLAVLVVFGVLQITYCLTCIRLTRSK